MPRLVRFPVVAWRLRVIVIKLRTLTVAALVLFVMSVGMVVAGDVLAGDWYLLSHVGLLFAAAGIALLVVAWLEKRLASVEKAFQIGVDAGQSNGRSSLQPLR